MKLTQIEYFMKVAEHLSYTIASKELYISQPALSKQISLLEESLGVKLFYRDNKGVELTEAGNKLQSAMKPILIQMSKAIEEVKNLGTECEQIRIGCFDGLEVEDLIKEIEIKLKNIGASLVDITLEDIRSLREHMDSGELDMGIIPEFSLPYFQGYNHRIYESRKGGIIYSKQHSLWKKENLTAKDFCGETFVTVDENMAPGAKKMMIENLKRSKIKPGKIITVPNMITLANHINRGKGVSILSKSVVNNKENNWMYWKLPEEELPFNILIICAKDGINSLTQRFIFSYNN